MRGRRKLFLGLAAFALWAAPAALAVAAPGELDPSFGAGGTSLIDLGGSEFGRDVALRPDGRIVITGDRSAGGNSDAVVAQLQPQGSLDPAYGGGSGWSQLDFGGRDTGYALALQADGKVVVTGQRTLAGATTSDAMVARLTFPGGAFDPSYGGGGLSVLDYGGSDTSYAVALQPDGRIVVAGSSFVAPAANGALARLVEPQGTFDPSFAGGVGWTLPDFGGNDAVNGIALQRDGRIVAVGGSTIGTVRDVVVARRTESGAPDPSFGGGTGFVRIDFAGFDLGEDVVIQPDGKIVIAGAGGPGDGDMAIARLNSDGTPDTTFGTAGKAFVDFGGVDDVSGVALQTDGKLVVAGTTYKAMSGNFAIARLQPGGALDTTFGAGGRTEVDLGRNDFAWEMVQRPDGRIVAVGESATSTGASDVAVVQLQGDPPAPGPVFPIAGLPPPTCAGKPATIVGTAGRDVLRGTTGADVIAALGGNDVVRGARGGDIICGGRGADRLLGGPGADRLFGGPGRDRLLGSLGADRLFGGPGRDRLLGGFGRDLLRGGLGRDAQIQ